MSSTPPPEGVLRQFRLGTLPPDQSAEVERWLDSSPAAVGILSRVQASDSVLDALSGPLLGLAAEALDANRTTGRSASGASAAPAAEPAEPAARLGKYRLGPPLGSGGMGQVFAAEQSDLGRRVAVKVISGGHGGVDQLRARFIREARAAAQIDHENVVPIYDIGEQDGRMFITMPLLRGESLLARLKREGALPAPEVVRIGRQAAAGLAAAHAARIAHRDIKPANIWLTEGAGRVQILDFGIAKALADEDATGTRTVEEALTRPGGIPGTPAYMSPEQAACAAVDHRTDLFSLGVVLYEAATGVRPFRGTGPLDVLFAVVNHSPDPPHQVRPGVPAELSELIMRLLAKKPADRLPATAAELEQAFAALAAPPPAAPAAPAPAAPPRPRRAIWAAIPLALALGAGGGYFGAQARAPKGGDTPSDPGPPREPHAARETAWGWNRPEAVEPAATPAAFRARLASLVEEWGRDKTDDPVALSRRLLELRTGCARLRLADLPLPDADRAALQDELQFWGQQITEQLALLEKLRDGPDARKKADDLVATIANWLRARA